MQQLPIHPRTGLRAIGILNGRPVWPVAGGAQSPIEVLEARETQLLGELELILSRAEQRDDKKIIPSEKRKLDAIEDNLAIVRGRMAEERRKQDRRQLQADADDRLNGLTSPDGTFRSHGFGNGADTVYARGSGNSYFRDLIAITQPGSQNAHEAMQRLQDHAQCVERAADDLPDIFRASPQRRGAHMEARVNPNRTDGQGGWFVPPLYLIDEFIPALRAGRPIADRCNMQPLPTGTDSINLPKIATGTAVAPQTADAAAITSVDLTDTSISAGVHTIAGQQDIAMQLLEQSPVAEGFDQVVMQDLTADYNQKLDVQVLSGSNANGQALGILNVAGVNAITYTDAAPDLVALWTPLMQSLSQIAKNRFAPPDAIGMHPSLWFWATTQLDTTNRPLIGLDGDSLNSLAIYSTTAAEGVVGAIGNIPIVIDANMPTNLGAGANESRIIAGRYKDAWLWEGALRTRVMTEVLSGTLQVRIQLYNYFAFMPNRLPTAFSIISGSGLIPQAGF